MISSIFSKLYPWLKIFGQSDFIICIWLFECIGPSKNLNYTRTLGIQPNLSDFSRVHPSARIPDVSHISIKDYFVYYIIIVLIVFFNILIHAIVSKFIYLIHNLLINDKLNNDEILFFNCNANEIINTNIIYSIIFLHFVFFAFH